MDQTPEYQGMLKQAPEIQELWILSAGDLLQRGSFIGMYSGNGYAYSLGPHKGMMDREQIYIPTEHWDIVKPQYLWLPHQDQLQKLLERTAIEIVSEDYEFQRGNAPYGLVAMHLIQHFREYHKEHFDYLRRVSFNSMEQLWLVFVMHVLFNKSWDGKQWNVNN